MPAANARSRSVPSAPARSRRSSLPGGDLGALPSEALLTRNQVAALTGFAVVTLRLWAREGRKGPRTVRVENHPRYRVSDVRDWLAKGGRSAPMHDIFA